jgi:hypothetical protein
MKEVEYSKMSRGRIGGMPRSSTALLSGRGGTLMRPGGSHFVPRKGSNLFMSLKSHGMGEYPTDRH